MARRNQQGNGGGTAVAVNKKKDFLALLDSASPQMKALLPKYMTPERMMTLVRLSASRTPKLYECDGMTVVHAVMQSAQLGLEIGGPVPGAHLVPFYNNGRKRMECQLIPDYRGLIQLAQASGTIRSADVRVVYRGEKFQVLYGTENKIIHEPDFEAIDRGEIVAFYFVATMPTGEKKFEVMTKKQVDEIMARSKAKDSGPWKTDYAEMGKKTVAKRGLKTIPMNPNDAEARKLAMAVEADNRFETGVATMIVPEWDDEESLSQEAAAQTGERLDELKQKMAGRDVSQDDQGSGASGPDRAQLNAQYFALVGERTEWEEFERKLWQGQKIGKPSTKEWDASDFEKAIQLLRRGELDFQLPTGAGAAASDDLPA